LQCAITTWSAKAASRSPALGRCDEPEMVGVTARQSERVGIVLVIVGLVPAVEFVTVAVLDDDQSFRRSPAFDNDW
jgi:hypothetical protein